MSVFIKLDKVSLSIPLFLQQERAASSWASVFLGAIFDPPRRRLAHVLNDISFEAHDGDRIALLGQNGAGKSTLLKVLNGIYAPTSGVLTTNGRRQGLLNMSLGFNAEATVRENIFLRGTAMGLDTGFLRQRIDSILDFAGLRNKDSHRLRTLSSGQRMRLGFSISTSVRQDILLMDEWVGASDANFMAQAKERLIDHAQGSSIVVLATHTVGLLRDICNKGMVLNDGRIEFFGDIDPALKTYQRVLAGQWALGTSRGTAGDQNAVKEHIYGYVDKLWFDKGKLGLKGWVTSAEGENPQHLAVEVKGQLHRISDFQRHNRSDVVRRFGLGDGKCGFNATIDVPGVDGPGDLDRSTVVLAGMDAENITTALRLAPAIEDTLRTGKPA